MQIDYDHYYADYYDYDSKSLVLEKNLFSLAFKKSYFSYQL